MNMTKEQVVQAFMNIQLEENYNFLEEDLVILANAFGKIRDKEIDERVFRAVQDERNRCITFVRSLNPEVASALENKKGPL